MVVLPAPVVPTRATVWPDGTNRSRPGSTGTPSTYSNRTWSKRRSPRASGNATGAVGSGTPGSSSRTPEIFSSAALADWKVL